MTFNLPEGVKYCLNALSGIGVPAYIVGGCVRDSLMGREPSDWDVCASTPPERIAECFKDDKIIPTGAAHGTLTLITPDGPVEITSCRADGTYNDHRRPDSVTFGVSLKEDLARRDFTVNAMAWSERGGLEDPFDGFSDLKAGILRCVGNPHDRFSEDALRIIRLFRFAAQLSFDIDPLALEAARDKSGDLLYVSAERISAEMCKLLTCPKPSPALIAMTKCGALQTIIPEFAPCVGFEQLNPYHNQTVDLHTFTAIDHSPAPKEVRIALLLHDIAKPCEQRVDDKGVGHYDRHSDTGADMADAILKRMRFSSRTVSRAVSLIRLHDTFAPATKKNVRRMLAQYGLEMYRQLIALQIADNMAKNLRRSWARLNSLKKVETIMEEIAAENPCLSIPQLEVNGLDVMSLGFEGREVGEELERLLGLVLDEVVPNKREELMAQSRQFYVRRR